MRGGKEAGREVRVSRPASKKGRTRPWPLVQEGYQGYTMGRKGAYCYACRRYLTCPGRGFIQLKNHWREEPECGARVREYYRVTREIRHSADGKELSRDR